MSKWQWSEFFMAPLDRRVAEERREFETTAQDDAPYYRDARAITCDALVSLIAVPLTGLSGAVTALGTMVGYNGTKAA